MLPPRTLAQRYVDEGLRMDEHPRVRCVDGAAGRRARVLGPRSDVWEVIAAVNENDGDIGKNASFLQLALGLVQAAVAYYGAFVDEIDEWIEAQRTPARARPRRVAAGQAALRR